MITRPPLQRLAHHLLLLNLLLLLLVPHHNTMLLILYLQLLLSTWLRINRLSSKEILIRIDLNVEWRVELHLLLFHHFCFMIVEHHLLRHLPINRYSWHILAARKRIRRLHHLWFGLTLSFDHHILQASGLWLCFLSGGCEERCSLLLVVLTDWNLLLLTGWLVRVLWDQGPKRNPCTSSLVVLDHLEELNSLFLWHIFHIVV